jgi:hypothetical protein
MRGVVVTALCLVMASAPLWAKLPAPTDEQKAAAAAKSAKAAEAAKKEAEMLGKSQDATAEKYKKSQSAKTKGAGPDMATPAAVKK